MIKRYFGFLQEERNAIGKHQVVNADPRQNSAALWSPATFTGPELPAGWEDRYAPESSSFQRTAGTGERLKHGFCPRHSEKLCSALLRICRL